MWDTGFFQHTADELNELNGKHPIALLRDFFPPAYNRETITKGTRQRNGKGMMSKQQGAR